MDLISVIMPTYNVEKYVAEAIESILNQTYKNIEFIIVDDFSTDGTYEICKSFAKKDNRIKLFKNTQNLRISRTLNFALTKVTGKFVARMDGDDISVPNRLEVMKKYLDSNPEIKLVGTGAITINEKGEEIGRTAFLNDFALIKKTCTLKSPVVHIWMTYKDVYEKLHGYRLVNPTEDYDFVLRCISSGFMVSNITGFYAYKIRINRSGNSTSSFGVRKLKSHKYTVKNYLMRLKSGKDDFSEKDYQKYIQCSKLSEMLYSLSNRFLYKSIDAKSRKNYFAVLFYCILSLVSPHQVKYLYETFKYKILTRGAK